MRQYFYETVSLGVTSNVPYNKEEKFEMFGAIFLLKLRSVMCAKEKGTYRMRKRDK
jgi:hypothetical protein